MADFISNCAQNETRGIAIAEGDVLVLSISKHTPTSIGHSAHYRAELATEMLQGRYKVPASTNPQSLLARHESSLFDENRAILASCAHHRSDEVNRRILPNCQPLIEAIGPRMAYDAAVAAGVQQDPVDLYEVSCMKLDAVWYSEEANIGRRALAEREARALDAVLPQLGELVRGMGVEPWVTAQITSDARWNAFVQSCELFEGASAVSVLPLPTGKTARLHPAEIVRSHL